MVPNRFQRYGVADRLYTGMPRVDARRIGTGSVNETPSSISTPASCEVDSALGSSADMYRAVSNTRPPPSECPTRTTSVGNSSSFLG